MHNKPHTDEAKRKMSAAKRGKKHSWEHRLKIGKASTGRMHTKETRQKMSNAHKGKTITQEQREKISKTLLGRPLSELAIQKLRARGGDGPSEKAVSAAAAAKLGKPRPPEIRQELSRQGYKAYKIFEADCSEIEKAASEGGHASPLVGFGYNAKRRIVRNILRKGIK
jgi:hypothetical protein